MCCGSGNDAGAGAAPAVAQLTTRDDPDQIYVVTYFNGVTEETEGLAGARNLLINPDARVEGARTVDDFPDGVVYGGTYAPKR